MVEEDSGIERPDTQAFIGKKIEVTLEVAQSRPLKETLTEAVRYLNHLEKGMEELAARIRTEGDAEAYTQLRHGLEGLSQVVELFGLVQEMQPGSEQKIETFKQFIVNLNEKCEEMTDAQEGRDPTLIADILEYELVESVQELRTHLEGLIPNVA